MAAVRVLVDANVLFSKTTRDWLFLLRNETGGNMYTVATTEDVIAETLYNFRKRRPDVDGGLITNIRSKIVTSIDELLEDYVVDGSYPGPDPHDAHVHAAAVACQADVLLTCDTGWFDLSEEELSRLPYEPQTPDCFFTLVDDSAPEAVRAVTANQLGYYLSKSPSVDLPEKLRKADCPTFAQRVGKHLQTIPLPKPAGGTRRA